MRIRSAAFRREAGAPQEVCAALPMRLRRAAALTLAQDRNRGRSCAGVPVSSQRTSEMRPPKALRPAANFGIMKLADAEQPRHLADMAGGGAAAADQIAVARVDAFVDRDVLDRGDHVVIAGRVDRIGGLDQARQIQLPGDACAMAASALARSSLMLAAQIIVGIDDAEHDIGVGHRRIGAAEAVAGGPRARAGALRPDLEEAARIDPGDRAAARADRAHIDLGDAEHLHAEGRFRRDDKLAVAQRRDVEGRAAHVDDDHIVGCRQMHAGDRRKRRTGHDAVDRPLDDLFGRHHAADAIGDQQFVPIAGLLQHIGQLRRVGADDRKQATH